MTIKFRNNYEIRFIGIPRSGNHAIIRWIASHFPEVYFYNNIKSDKTPQTHPIIKWPDGDYNRRFRHKVGLGEVEFRECVMYSVENLTISRVKDKISGINGVTNHFDLGLSKKEFDVLILRDPFNMIASNWKHAYSKRKQREWDLARRIKVMEDLLFKWEGYALEFLRETTYLKDPILISFNNWFSNKEYRKEISSKLGLVFSDKVINHVPYFGGSSSFDKKRYDGRAQQMKVLERWKIFKNDKYFRCIFKDQEIWELSNKIFGDMKVEI